MSALSLSSLGEWIGSLDRRNLRRWIGPYLVHRARQRTAVVPSRRHLIFALCDHYEPLWHQPTTEVGDRRVALWEERYPAMAEPFVDADGRHPRHSFFFAAEEYQPSYLERLSRLVEGGFGEVELHLHHDRDSAAGLRQSLSEYLDTLRRHGHLGEFPDGRRCFGFIHGNWCLANSRPDGTLCGVDDELEVLWQAGCYADYTFPSAPDVTQPPLVNQIYWPRGDIGRRAAHESGEEVMVGARRHDRPLMISGPLALVWDRRRKKPRIENGALTGSDPATAARVDAWVRQNIVVPGREEWVFVKVHTHGATEDTADSLLGDGGRQLHRALQRYNDGDTWKLHYVSAREMANVVLAAIDGHGGEPAEFFDYHLRRPPILG